MSQHYPLTTIRQYARAITAARLKRVAPSSRTESTSPGNAKALRRSPSAQRDQPSLEELKKVQGAYLRASNSARRGCTSNRPRLDDGCRTVGRHDA
jgi:hypothetical protein